MQRQSLGSPLSKLHLQSGGGAGAAAKDVTTHSVDDDRKSSNKARRFSLPVVASSSSVLASSSSSSSSSTSSPKPEKLIHLIPLFTLLCFLVLYFVSHTPSQSDLAGFELSYKHNREAISELNDVDRFSSTELRRGADVLAIRSFRKLQESADRSSTTSSSPKSRFHRKLAHF